MREKLNENPVAQIAVVGVLLLVVGFFALSQFSGKSEESEATPTEAAVEAPAEEIAEPGLEEPSAAAASSAVAPSARSLPPDVEAAYENGETIVLLIYRPGGIDDRRVTAAADAVSGMENVALFKAPAGEVARYVAITGPLGVNQAPALVVIRSRDLNEDAAAPATVSYGFQNSEDIRQAVVDSEYRGPELTYAPD